MARKPFFSGNYGSALARVDTRPIMEAGRAQGQMFANMGQQIGGMIQQYGLNKEKRNKLQATLEGQLSADPSIMQALTMTGDEAYDKKNQTLFDKVQSGNASIPDLERANGLLAGRTTQENAMLKKQNAETLQQKNELELSLGKALKNPTIAKALADAQVAESNSMYAKSVASANYAKKVADTALTRAQTVYYDAKSKAEKNSETYKPGQKVDIEGQSGNKVSFVWTGNSLQPLNDTISKKVIEEAMIEGLDQASLMAYLDKNYDYDEDTESYDFKGKSNAIGYGGGEKNPMMEQAITLLGLRGQIKPSEDDTPAQEEVGSSMPKEVPTITTQEEFDALPSGAIYLGSGGKKRRKP
jgi:hypothetical protein